MSGETEKQMSGWTVDTLKYHIDQRFIDSEKAVEAALQAAKEAVDKANTASEKRFDSVNEFRKTLSDQTNTFVPRLEYVSQHKALEDKVTALTDRMNISDGRIKGSDLTMSKLYAAIGTGVAIISIIVVLANAIFK